VASSTSLSVVMKGRILYLRVTVLASLFASLFVFNACQTCGTPGLKLNGYVYPIVIGLAVIGLPILHKILSKNALFAVAAGFGIVGNTCRTIIASYVNDNRLLCEIGQAFAMTSAILGGPMLAMAYARDAPANERPVLISVFGTTTLTMLWLLSQPAVEYAMDPVKGGMPYSLLFTLVVSAAAVLCFVASRESNAHTQQQKGEGEGEKEKSKGKDRSQLADILSSLSRHPPHVGVSKLFLFLYEGETDAEGGRIGGGFSAVEAVYRFRRPSLPSFLVLGLLLSLLSVLSLCHITMVLEGAAPTFYEMRHQEIFGATSVGFMLGFLLCWKLRLRTFFKVVAAATTLLTLLCTLSPIVPISSLLTFHVLSRILGGASVLAVGWFAAEILPRRLFIILTFFVLFTGITGGVHFSNFMWEKKTTSAAIAPFRYVAPSHLYTIPSLLVLPVVGGRAMAAVDVSADQPQVGVGEDGSGRADSGPFQTGSVLRGSAAVRYALSKVNVSALEEDLDEPIDVKVSTLRELYTVALSKQAGKSGGKTEASSGQEKKEMTLANACNLDISPLYFGRAYTSKKALRSYVIALKLALLIYELRGSDSYYPFYAQIEEEVEGESVFPLGTHSITEREVSILEADSRALRISNAVLSLKNGKDLAAAIHKNMEGAKEVKRGRTLLALTNTTTDGGSDDGGDDERHKDREGDGGGTPPEVMLREMIEDGDLTDEAKAELKVRLAAEERERMRNADNAAGGSEKGGGNDTSKDKVLDYLHSACQKGVKNIIFDEKTRKNLRRLSFSPPCPFACCVATYRGKVGWGSQLSRGSIHSDTFASLIVMLLKDLLAFNTSGNSSELIGVGEMVGGVPRGGGVEVGKGKSKGKMTAAELQAATGGLVSFENGKSEGIVDADPYVEVLRSLFGDDVIEGDSLLLMGLKDFLETASMPAPRSVLKMMGVYVAGLVACFTLLLVFTSLKPQRVEVVSM